MAQAQPSRMGRVHSVGLVHCADGSDPVAIRVAAIVELKR